MQSGNDINLEASNLTANNQINLNAQNDVNIEAVNDVYYTDVQSTKKGRFSKKTQRDMTYKESVVQSNLKGENIIISSDTGSVTLESGNLKADKNIIVDAKGDINIVAKEYKEGELHQTSKSSFGGLIKSEYKYDKDNLKIKSTEITADNMILDAKEINVQASRIKANEVEISTEILNMISSKERLYENEYSNKGGIITATIENKGQIKEIVIPATIEVNDRLIFNKKDITDQLETDNLIKVLSSQGNLSEEQINLVKQIANDNDWHTKTTTLSATGALIVQAIVTYFTASAGSGLTSSISNVALKAATNAAIQSVISQITVQLATSAITGNSLQLDVNSIAKGAVSAGVLTYANALAYNQFDINTTQQLSNLQLAQKTLIDTTTQTAVYGRSFTDNLLFNAGNTIQSKLSNIIGDNYINEELNYTTHKLAHLTSGAIGATIRKEDLVSGALGAVSGEVIGEAVGINLIKDGDFTQSDEKIVKLTSSLGTIFTAGALGKDAKVALNSSNVAVDNNIVPLLAILAGVTATQSYLNSPEDEDDIKTGITGSENLLLGIGTVLKAREIYQGGKTAVTSVMKYDPSLSLTGAGVATGISAHSNYDKYNGAEYATHVATDGTISYLVGKYIPAGQNIASSLGYGALGGSLSGASTQLLHQASDIYYGNQTTMNYQSIFFNSIIEGTAGATGKFYNNMGDMINGGHIINDVIDLGISQSFKPAVEWHMSTPRDQAKQESE
ncbi:hemagglutinin repeat-containing protein [Arcobacter sp. FWKO B]|uniref:hemagglutinin repeat-containing protein n=1 Tax=Arcobacter sp. FWKO B TaxID=2593672 RepID=UPI0018A5F8AD|nr:hemagglutinin repeat-containing protein [Arcobacter sp. FWKO B]QOG13279.1 hypothetical protein FWKOB_06920 [Arcobacter sp. FWKO B]